MESYSRVRSVKLARSNPEGPFGFSVRGGHEHGTGIFVSCVNPRSIAFRQGLKVGDQILRVNGFPVSAAVHHECLALMRLRPSLHLKVRSVGMLPVKEKAGDALSWKLVEEEPPPPPTLQGEGESGSRGISRLSDTSSHSLPDCIPTEAKVFIDMSGRNGLGCCICKGPVERPGIFVQSTKAGGVAREAGLRPGDQLLSCNGHSFLHVPFAEAVQHLKVSPQLRLRVLKGVASDLFPGESSSGYNSSASSLNGDQGGGGPGEGSKRRLHRVSEEQLMIEHHNRPTPSGVHLDQGMEWDEVEQVWRSAERETILIEVKGSSGNGGGGGGSSCGVRGGNSDPNRTEEQRLLAEERRKLEETQRRLLEEALKLEEEKRRFQEERRRVMNSGSGSGSGGGSVSNGGGSMDSNNTLVGALNQEILKRVERRESDAPAVEEDYDNGDDEVEGDRLPRPGTVEAKRTLFNNQIDVEKRQQHEQLIEEFKRAHRKMFAPDGEGDPPLRGDSAESGDSAAAELIRSRRVQKELDHERQMVAQRVAGIVRQRQLRIERQHQESAETEREIIRCKSPPPPPPMPTPDQIHPDPAPVPHKKAQPPPIHVNPAPKRVVIEEKPVLTRATSRVGAVAAAASSNKTTTKGKAPPPPTPQRSAPASSRPESPSPDYSNSPSPIPTRAHPNKSNKSGSGGGGGNRVHPLGVDMHSLESFRLKDPPRSPKKPPPVYFPHGNNNNNPMQHQQHQQHHFLPQQSSTTMMTTPSSTFVEGNNAKNEALSGILKGSKTISFLDNKY